MFGTSPASIFSHVGLVMKETSRGYRFEYEPLGPTHGTLCVTSENLHECRFTAAAWAAGFDAVLDVCKVQGDVVAREPVHVRNDSITGIDVSWTRD